MSEASSANNGPAFSPHDTPGVASLEDGHVLLDGPDGVAVTMTIEAAKGTAESLLRAVDQARKSV